MPVFETEKMTAAVMGPFCGCRAVSFGLLHSLRVSWQQRGCCFDKLKNSVFQKNIILVLTISTVPVWPVWYGGTTILFVWWYGMVQYGTTPYHRTIPYHYHHTTTRLPRTVKNPGSPAPGGGDGMVWYHAICTIPYLH